MTHAISWFEIPATDYDRAAEFYSTVLDHEIDEYHGDAENGRYGLFRTEEEEVGGAISQQQSTSQDSNANISSTPSDDKGIVVYLTVEGDLTKPLSKVEPAGGEVIVGKSQTEGGYYGLIKDTEGNRIGLRSEE